MIECGREMARGEGSIIRGYRPSSLLLGDVYLFLGSVVMFLGGLILFLEVDEIKVWDVGCRRGGDLGDGDSRSK